MTESSQSSEFSSSHQMFEWFKLMCGGFLVPAPSASGNPGCAPGRLYLCCQLGGARSEDTSSWCLVQYRARVLGTIIGAIMGLLPSFTTKHQVNFCFDCLDH